MSDYAIYLRKSRIDAEAERAGEGETLARHRKALTDLAAKRGYNVTKIYEEVVSGETIISRPRMQQLMSDVEQGLYAGVLVMEVERLARGDTIDQGLVAQTFKYSNTLIITPIKIYDPNDEFDEEFFEFGLFMSRREYKTINRRLQRGREASAKEGKWLFPVAPYGYKRKPLTDQKGTTLEVIEEQAAVVRMIFDLYVNGIEGQRLGIQSIAHRLNELKIPASRHDYWDKGVVRDILNNPVYAGKIRYGYRREKKIIVNGIKKTTRPISYNDNCIIADGLHEAIISQELFEKAQALADLRPIMPVGYKKEIKNPLAGLVFCKLCGRRMSMRKSCRPNNPDYLVCHARTCPNVSTPLHIVEERVIDSLREWVQRYEIEITNNNSASFLSAQIDVINAQLTAKNKELETLTKQLDGAYDLLEQGIYTIEKFQDRSHSLTERINTAQSDIELLEVKKTRLEQQNKMQAEIVPRVKSILQAYEEAETAAKKNELLREILQKAVYYKEKSGCYRGISVDDFELELFPLLPEYK